MRFNLRIHGSVREFAKPANTCRMLDENAPWEPFCGVFMVMRRDRTLKFSPDTEPKEADWARLAGL